MKYANCHPDRPNHCKGLCVSCYTQKRRDKVQEWKVKNKVRMLDRQHSYARSLPERTKANWRMRQRFGITIEQYEEILKKQGGVCAICGRSYKYRRLSIDHDHKTGKVRGILCAFCNTTLHTFDNRKRLRKVLEYLELESLLRALEAIH